MRNAIKDKNEEMRRLLLIWKRKKEDLEGESCGKSKNIREK